MEIIFELNILISDIVQKDLELFDQIYSDSK